MNMSYRGRLLASTLLVGAFAFATPAVAQDTQSPDPTAQPPSGPVEAQPIPSVSAQGEPVSGPQEIIVTGSRIPQPNLESAAPVTVVSNEDIKLSGLGRIDDVINQLPSAAASQGPGLPNPATGTAEIDLRYLGAKRTLSLINGRRMVPGDPNATSQAGDVNIVPAFIVKRVEVLTGGASSVYGADAVAGVVNFIMDTTFSGLRLDAQISGYQHNNKCPGISGGQTVCDALDDRINAGFVGFDYPKGSHWDGRAIDANIGYGINFDDGRGHAVGYFGYRKQNAVLQADRDFSACNLSGSTTPTCGGSSFSAEGNFLLGGDLGFFTRGGDGSLLPGRTRYNYAPLNHWIRPDERYVGGVFADYEINPAIKPYLEFMFMDDHTKAQIAPSGNFANTFSINCDNPFLNANPANAALVCQPDNLVTGFLGNFPLVDPTGATLPLTFFDSRGNTYQQAFFQIFKRNVEGGPRINDLKHTTYRAVVGTRGDLTNAFSYDGYYQYGKANYSQVYRNEFSAQRLARSVNVVNVDPATGLVVPVGTPGSVIECRSVLDGSDPNCVPYNYFDPAGPSPEAVNYLNVFGVIDGQTTEQIGHLDFTGALGELGWTTPWAHDGVGVNVGWEYRKEALVLNPDQLFQQGDLTGQGAPTLPVDGNFHVNELFAEVQVPIVQDNFIDELTLGAGYRKSWYKTHDNQTGFGRKYDTDTYKISLEFAPIHDIRLRGSYNRAVRAPNIVELFAPQFVGLDGATDPCATDAPITADMAGCIAQLQAAGIASPVGRTIFSNPSEQYNGLLGGVPTLNPETATTKTVGFVVQPRFIPRLAFTADYWNIKVDDAIQGFGADTILADCVANTTDPANPAPSCALVHRDAGGSLWLTPQGFVADLPSNSGKIKTDGFDFTAAYSTRTGFGGLSWSFLGTYLNHYKVNNSIAPTYDCAGFYGTVCSGASVASSSAMPHWRHKLRTTLSNAFGVNSLGLSLNWRMVGKVKFEHESSDQALAGDPNQLNERVKAQHYFDLAATYTLLDRVNLRAGINNILDNDPPIIPTANGACPDAACAGNTLPQTWDYLGRYLYAGLTVDFAPPRALPPPPPPAPLPPPPPPAAPATITCPDGLVILANQSCPALPPPPPPPEPAPERG
jgi:outer membrane receptor protein involved in Fe transport